MADWRIRVWEVPPQPEHVAYLPGLDAWSYEARDLGLYLYPDRALPLAKLFTGTAATKAEAQRRAEAKVDAEMARRAATLQYRYPPVEDGNDDE